MSENAYPFSSKWSHFHLYEKKIPFTYDIIRYPSVVNSKSQNYAIHTDFFDNHYKLKKIYEVYPIVEPEHNDQNLVFYTDSIWEPDSNYDEVIKRKFNEEDGLNFKLLNGF
jgi:hypothetical protein